MLLCDTDVMPKTGKHKASEVVDTPAMLVAQALAAALTVASVVMKVRRTLAASKAGQ